MAKIKDNVYSIFGQGIKLYFKNFLSFLKYMAFPVFGQIAGIILILLTTSFYSENIQKWAAPGSILDNFMMIFLILIILMLPGLFILIKAFWDYLIVYGSVNSMLENMLKSGRVYDFYAHNEVVTRRSSTFILIWALFAVLGIIGLFPLFLVILGILLVYFVLVFQVFTFEPDKSAFECFKKSITLIKGNFARTLGLLTLVGGVTYFLLPELVKYLFEVTKILTFLSIPFDSWARQLPVDEINRMLLKTPLAYQITSLGIAKYIVSALLTYIAVGITLPLRCICWALWYKNLNKSETKPGKKILERTEAKS